MEQVLFAKLQKLFYSSLVRSVCRLLTLQLKDHNENISGFDVLKWTNLVLAKWQSVVFWFKY